MDRGGSQTGEASTEVDSERNAGVNREQGSEAPAGRTGPECEQKSGTRSGAGAPDGVVTLGAEWVSAVVQDMDGRVNIDDSPDYCTSRTAEWTTLERGRRKPYVRPQRRGHGEWIHDTHKRLILSATRRSERHERGAPEFPRKSATLSAGACRSTERRHATMQTQSETARTGTTGHALPSPTTLRQECLVEEWKRAAE